MRATDSHQADSRTQAVSTAHAFHIGKVACEHCGSVYGPFPLSVNETATCPLCRSELCKHDNFSVMKWLALALTTLMVFVLANAYPVATMAVQGVVRHATLLDAVRVTWQQGYEAVAAMALLTGFILPLALLASTLWILFFLSQSRKAPAFSLTIRFLHAIVPWCMVPVFLLGVLVAVIKLAGMASVSAGIGLYAFAVLMVLLTLLRRLDSKVLWRHAEDVGLAKCAVPVQLAPGEALGGCRVCGLVQNVPVGEKTVGCLRCRAPVRYRRPDHVGRTWALIIAASILYIPANVFPVMHITTLFGSSAHTIMGGVVDLWRAGSMDIAIIVFIASVVVPLTKLLALVALLISAQRDSTDNLRARTRLYEIVEFIGQWSMLDVFVVVLLSALADFPGLSQIHAGSGAAAFGLVVMLTMLAAMSYDPRRAWDATVADLELDPEPSAPGRPAGIEQGST